MTITSGIKNPVTESQSKKIVDGQSDKILLQMAELFQSLEMLGSEMDSSVKNLEDEMKEGFETEGIRRKEDCKNLEEKMIVKIEQGFKNEQTRNTAGSKLKSCHEGRDQEPENGQWQHSLQRCWYRSGTGIRHLCWATAAFLPVD